LTVRTLIVPFFALLLSLNCFGQAPSLSTNATSFDFGGVPIGGIPEIPPGPERDVVITNNGNALLTVSDIQTTGDFALSHLSPQSFQLNAGDLRGITLQFVATAAGSRSGTVTFTDNAPGSPQTFALTGIGLTNDFSVAVQTTPASATINAGQGAGFTLNLASGNQFPASPITLGCTGLPPGGNLIVTTQGFSTQLGLTPGELLILSVSVATRATAVATSQPKLPWYGMGSMVGITLLLLKTKRRAMAAIIGLLAIAFGLVSCSSGPSFADMATPPGTYNLVFTATSGTTTHTAPATLIVK